jgi:methyl-accepting chemotaxis protein
MFSKLTIRARLLILLATIAIVAAGISSYVGFYIARKSLEEQAFSKLTAMREMKTSQVQDYFKQIANQVVTLSEDRMIVEAMKVFKTAFKQIDKELGGNRKQLDEFDLRLRLYYQDDFLSRLNPNLEGTASLSSYWPPGQNTRILQFLYIAANPFNTGSKDILDRSKDSSTYSRAHGLYHPIIQSYLKKFGYHDIFLVDHETGHIVYSVFKEVDFGTSLLTGPYRDTNFAQVFQEARSAGAKDFVRLIDFKPYHPSYNGQASFIASPIFDGTRQIGVLVFQMPVDRINNIMTNNHKWSDIGLGKSGETYIVGADYKLRTQSRFLAEDKQKYLDVMKDLGVPAATLKQMENTGQAIGLQEVRTPGAVDALKGQSGTLVFPDYRGIPVLSSYEPLDISDVQWAIMSEIDKSEALAPADVLRNSVLVLLLVLIIGSIVVAMAFSRTLTRPLRALSEKAEDLAQGKLDIKIETQGQGEIAALSRSFDAMRQSIKASIERQAAIIDALTIPLIPLQDEVVVMPLVGEFDDRRVKQLNDALVEGIHASRARVAIIDVTGVAVFNETFASGLRRAVAAARLLGVQVVITGMQPDMAGGLADVGERLHGVETRPSLQDGIDFAVGHRRQSMKDNLRIME